MAEEKTYLELSQTEGSHKFYEATIVNDTEVSIRYGRIGDRGQVQVKSYPTAEKAKAEVTKKINEKLRKGYEVAVMGVRAKRSVTRRQIVSNTSSAQSSTCTVAICFRFSSFWHFCR